MTINKQCKDMTLRECKNTECPDCPVYTVVEERSPDATGLIAEFLQDLKHRNCFQNPYVEGLIKKWEERQSDATDKREGRQK